MRRSLLSALLAALALAACGSGRAKPTSQHGVPWASSGIDWSQPPAVAPSPRWQPPAIGEYLLPNGIRLLVVENHRLPLASLSAVHLGAPVLAQTIGFAALDALDEGETTLASDYVALRSSAPSGDLRAVLARTSAALEKLPVADDAVATTRDKRVNELRERRDRPRTIAAQVFDRVVFGDHPYGSPVAGRPDAVSRLTPAEVVKAWGLRPDVLVVVGDVTPAMAREHAEKTLGAWSSTSTSTSTSTSLPAYQRRLAYVDIPGADEVAVIVGGRAPAAGHAQQLAADVANMILGGGDAGRLDRVLHGERGYTFGASSSFWRGKHAGSWSAAATFRVDVAGDGIAALLGLIEQTRTTEPTTAELAAARTNLVRGTAALFETTTGATRAVERLVTQGYPLDYYATLDARLGALTPAQVRAAVDATWRDLSIVVVGDWAKLVSRIDASGLAVQAYSRDGDPVR